MSGGIDRRKKKIDACPGDLRQHIREPEIANPPVHAGFTHSRVVSPIPGIAGEAGATPARSCIGSRRNYSSMRATPRCPVAAGGRHLRNCGSFYRVYDAGVPPYQPSSLCRGRKRVIPTHPVVVAGDCPQTQTALTRSAAGVRHRQFGCANGDWLSHQLSHQSHHL